MRRDVCHHNNARVNNLRMYGVAISLLNILFAKNVFGWALCVKNQKGCCVIQ
jgi:hypothetical protein